MHISRPEAGSVMIRMNDSAAGTLLEVVAASIVPEPDARAFRLRLMRDLAGLVLGDPETYRRLPGLAESQPDFLAERYPMAVTLLIRRALASQDEYKRSEAVKAVQRLAQQLSRLLLGPLQPVAEEAVRRPPVRKPHE